MKQRIGFFDSGVGGLSLLPAVQNSLPHEDIIYIADHGFFPYGEKSKEAMLNRAKLLTEALIEQLAVNLDHQHQNQKIQFVVS